MAVSEFVASEAEAQPPGAVPVADPGPGRRPRPPVKPRPTLRAVALTLSLAGMLLLGFFVYLYGLSGISEARAQSTLYKSFAGQLSAATAPVGPTVNSDGTTKPIPEGAPVAILSIPRLGISDLVVVEGTTSGDLMHGPGHVRASSLPGQTGVSVVYGRAATFGAPFAHLMQLTPGDTISVTTGQGISTYQVASFGTAKTPAPDPTANRLVLETADSAVFPTGAGMVSADLRSTAQPNPGGWPAITPQERYLAGDPGALIPLVLWSQALLLTSVGAVVAANRWSRWPTYLCAAPVAFALVWSVYENLAVLLPNLY